MKHDYGVYVVSDFFLEPTDTNIHLGKSKYSLPDTERDLNTR